MSGVDDTALTAAVNATGWEKLPIADRDTTFAFREAMDRLASAATSVEQFSSWFFYRDPRGAPNNRNSYRLPFADVFADGTVKLVPAAVFSAAAQLSGAHGAASIPANEQAAIRKIIDRIYEKFQTMWEDPRQVTPWNRPPGKSAADAPVKETETASIEEESDMGVIVGDTEPELETVTAAAFAPPAALFANPNFTGPTKMRVTDDGQYRRVQGHIAQFGVCHRGVRNSCIMAPRSATDYAQFKTGSALTADGGVIAVGKLTMGTGHADTNLGFLPAAAHYDNTGTGVAIVNVGEDAHGIWASGVMLPGVSDEQVVSFRASPISGDWRLVGRSLELVAALAVNTPGFPIDEPQYAMRASGEQESLVAAGILVEEASCGCELTAAAEAEEMSKAEQAANERADRLLAEAAALKEKMDSRRAARIIDLKLPVRG